VCTRAGLSISDKGLMQGKWANLFFTDLLFSLISTNDSRLMKSPVSLSVCTPRTALEPLGLFSWELAGR
jgi:hypothetical protein